MIGFGCTILDEFEKRSDKKEIGIRGKWSGNEDLYLEYELLTKKIYIWKWAEIRFHFPRYIWKSAGIRFHFPHKVWSDVWIMIGRQIDLDGQQNSLEWNHLFPNERNSTYYFHFTIKFFYSWALHSAHNSFNTKSVFNLVPLDSWDVFQ